MAVLQRYGPAEKLGLDEVFVDATAEVSRHAGSTSQPDSTCSTSQPSALYPAVPSSTQQAGWFMFAAGRRGAACQSGAVSATLAPSLLPRCRPSGGWLLWGPLHSCRRGTATCTAARCSCCRTAGTAQWTCGRWQAIQQLRRQWAAPPLQLQLQRTAAAGRHCCESAAQSLPRRGLLCMLRQDTAPLRELPATRCSQS